MLVPYFILIFSSESFCTFRAIVENHVLVVLVRAIASMCLSLMVTF